MLRHDYITKLTSLLAQVSTDDTIDVAAQIIVQAITEKHLIYAFGASHAGILTEEMFYRAGGLALINPVFDKNLMLDVKPVTKTSDMENLAGFGKIIAQNVPFKAGDVLIAHSVSGRNAVMLDLVLFAKERGVKVVAITNVAYSKSVASRHESRKRLFEIADIVIDNHGEIGDASMTLPGSGHKVAPTSTVVGAAIVNSLLLAIAERLPREKDRVLPIFASANMDGTREHNNRIFSDYKDQILYQ
ncbi:sugar isomerase domain-containing protein [Entomospira culicis]|uniref:SIS domain-containing protein n=1 Tax=Entomospira culicis TaxID=2719989 RepID=A0A968GGK3_9SPIO|nr:SIS domain-containing protein [Entomospira culicis]NIZ19222.1 SIS domain-containing protein [Entomospira culicis]NIZ69436.1 SIS domain-containing protein [Entomospira culicis]WDI36552.1 SIS domain-containing protein [Entomospira culicis]WDI38178.1 SIS domain-containing protein [Entomospira culicis]